MQIFKKLSLFFIHRDNSLSVRLRKRRFKLFLDLIKRLPKPINVLDVGGVEAYWERVNYTDSKNVRVVLYNIVDQSVKLPNFKAVVGDARDLSQFSDKQFDVVFSNSLIEHVGNYEDQKRVAEEIMRTGKRYFVQTPNFYFPIEQHLLVPFFQFFPLSIKLFILRYSKLFDSKKITDRNEWLKIIKSYQLLTLKEMKELFPGCKIYKEKFLAFTKSITAIGGWE